MARGIGRLSTRICVAEHIIVARWRVLSRQSLPSPITSFEAVFKMVRLMTTNISPSPYLILPFRWQFSAFGSSVQRWRSRIVTSHQRRREHRDNPY